MTDPKPTGNKELDLLIKLLAMTTSDNDNIALVSIRKANDQLAKFNQTWDALLRGRVTVVADPFNGPTIEEPKARSPFESKPSAPSAPMRPRPTPRQAPPVWNPPPPQPQPAPKPAWNSGAGPSASGSFSSQRQGKPNRFAAHCHKCGARVPAMAGFLSHQNAAGQWEVECSSACTLPKGKNAQRGFRPTVDQL